MMSKEESERILQSDAKLQRVNGVLNRGLLDAEDLVDRLTRCLSDCHPDKVCHDSSCPIHGLLTESRDALGRHLLPRGSSSR